MSNETFLISIKQNNDLSKAAESEIRMDTELHPLHQRSYIQMASLPGNSRKYSVNQVETNKGKLYNKKILFLGSSVTFGFGSLGESFVDYLWKKDGVIAIKDAENGTTLVNQDTYYSGDSYVSRFKEELVSNMKPDAFVLQLSTNDAQKKKELGKFAAGPDFNLQTIIGSLQFIIETAQREWNCPIVLFTNPYFNSGLYAKMVAVAKQITEKYNISLINLYQKADFKNLSSLYQADYIHPTRAGYYEKWLPVFEAELNKLF